jgi:hypothetical protein
VRQSPRYGPRVPRRRPLLALGLLVLASVCVPRPRPTVDRWGAVLSRVTGQGPDTPRDALPGDTVLRARSARILIGGDARPLHARGTVVSATLDAAPADARPLSLAPCLLHGDEVVPVRIDRVVPTLRPEGASIDLAGSATVAQRAVSVAWTLSMLPTAPVLELTVTLALPAGWQGPAPRPVWRVAWGAGSTAFVPGTGALQDDTWRLGSWIGSAQVEPSAALAFRDGALRARQGYEQHGTLRVAAYTDVAWAGGEGTGPVRALLSLAPGGLAEAVQTLGHARSMPFATVTVRVPHNPPGSVVRVLTEDGRVVGRARTQPDPDAPETGLAVVPITPLVGESLRARYVAVATAWGHAPSDPVPFAPTEGAAVSVEIPRGGSVRVTALDAATQTRIPARVRFKGLDGATVPELGPDWRAAGARDVVVMPEGSATVPLPPGKYRVVVSHGPEWTLHAEVVTVTATARADVRAELQHVIDPGPWVGCDLHVHAAPSPDSRVSLADRVAALAAEGVGFAVPTDHNTVTDYGPPLAALGLDDTMATLPGVEVTTWDPQFGHFNAFPVPFQSALPDHGAPRYTQQSPASLFAAMRALGPDTLVQVNHPRLEPDVGYFNLLQRDARTGAALPHYSPDFDLLEVYNGFDIGRRARVDALFDEWLGLVAQGHRVVATGSSDSHNIRYQWAGYPRTYVAVPPADRSPRALLRALRAGRAFVTNGPFLEATVDGHGPGDTAPVTGDTARVHVVVRAPDWMDLTRVEVFSGPTLRATAPIAPRPTAPHAETPVVRFDQTLTVPVTPGSFVVVRASGDGALLDLLARGDALPLAFTNPIWLAAPAPAAPPGTPLTPDARAP